MRCYMPLQRDGGSDPSSRVGPLNIAALRRAHQLDLARGVQRLRGHQGRVCPPVTLHVTER